MPAQTREKVTPLSWGARILFGLIAFVGTVVYAASFGIFEQSENILQAAKSIGVSSGLSWIGFGAVLLGATRFRPSILAWADACLRAQAAGIAVLMASVLVNLMSLAGGSALSPSGTDFKAVHAVILIAADVLMAVLFARRATRLGMRFSLALALWIFVLNGLFILFLIAGPVPFY
jgi:hypothetical protein